MSASLPSLSDTEVRGFAELVLKVLDLQHEYFRRRDPTMLGKCRDAERELRKTAVHVIGIIDLEPVKFIGIQGTIFGMEPTRLPD